LTIFPLWIAQNKHKILIYDAKANLICKYPYTPTKEAQIKHLVNLCNKYYDLSLLEATP
jgi:hypothetical protein